MARVFIAFGANMPGPAGDPVHSFCAAKNLLVRRGVRFVQESSLFASDPWGGVRQPIFLNGVWEVRSPYGPQELLVQLLKVEKCVGRRRRVRWGPRAIDLDLLVFGKKQGVWGGENPLELPHPRMDQRAFVMLPLAELAPELRPWGAEKRTIGQVAGRMAVRERFTLRRAGRN